MGIFSPDSVSVGDFIRRRIDPWLSARVDVSHLPYSCERISFESSACIGASQRTWLSDFAAHCAFPATFADHRSVGFYIVRFLLPLQRQRALALLAH